MSMTALLKAWMPIFFGTLLTLSGGAALAQKGGLIGYQLAQETWDDKTKTYTLDFEFWSKEKVADSFEVSVHAESEKLKILTQKTKKWKGPYAADAVLKHQVRVKNDSGEGLPFKLEIKRISGKRADTKTVSVLVAPQ